MDQFYTSSIASSIQFYQFYPGDGGGSDTPDLSLTGVAFLVVAIWVVPWLSRGLSHGCPRGCPAGCPVVVPWVVPRLYRGGPAGVPWFRIRAHRHMIVCLAVSICMHEKRAQMRAHMQAR